MSESRNINSILADMPGQKNNGFSIFFSQVPPNPKQSKFTGMISRCFEPHLNIYIDSQDRYNIFIFIILCFYLIKFNEVLEKLVVHDSRRASTPEPIKTLKDAYCPITVLEHGIHLNVREPYFSKTTRFFKIFTVLDKITYFFPVIANIKRKTKKMFVNEFFSGPLCESIVGVTVPKTLF